SLPDGEPFLAMEWIQGPTLSDRLAREGLGVPAAVHLVTVRARALGAAHQQGIVHRDVKPSNVLLVDGSVERVKVVDFGVARSRRSVSVTATGAAVGTLL